MKGNFERIYAVIKRIPKGKVATYGQVAKLAGLPRHARQVGFALAALPEGAKVPWQRVVNAGGKVSAREHPNSELRQRALLEREKVAFDERGRISLARAGWTATPRARRPTR
jgi:methylated-DNA-protein-cysteine methyltransferase-like protein